MASALSGRQVGRTCTPKPEAFTAAWCSSVSQGSSVVQTSRTLLRVMRPRALKPGSARRSAVADQTVSAVAGVSRSKRSK
ncbi:MAG: hypothetical protein BWX70_02230 [Verrucomicrobia bacterium ADurb.Bin070]|nr:MAG: hypothetical protein BWX70_02230 [Verrucomicrobia bacterium ADurb.Bin070]